jgi:dienelactone hydrolase
VLLTPLQLHREVDMSLDGFEVAPFEHEGVLRPVYRRGNGPGVVIMHEIPGITPEVAGFARRVADAGFSVVMPSLFGTPGQEFSNGYVAGQMARACISREFHVLAKRASSPITDFLRALAQQVHRECGGPGVGAVGMCLTGNFALSMMLDDVVMAPVLSQPSLPFGISQDHRSAIHLSNDDLDIVKERTRNGCCVLGLRFTGDPLVPAERFETLRQVLSAGFEAIEIDSSKGNPYGIPAMAHSVLTKDLVDEEGHPTRAALERVLALFRERLLPT